MRRGPICLLWRALLRQACKQRSFLAISGSHCAKSNDFNDFRDFRIYNFQSQQINDTPTTFLSQSRNEVWSRNGGTSDLKVYFEVQSCCLLGRLRTSKAVLWVLLRFFLPCENKQLQTAPRSTLCILLHRLMHSCAFLCILGPNSQRSFKLLATAISWVKSCPSVIVCCFTSPCTIATDLMCMTHSGFCQMPFVFGILRSHHVLIYYGRSNSFEEQLLMSPSLDIVASAFWIVRCHLLMRGSKVCIWTGDGWMVSIRDSAQHLWAQHRYGINCEYHVILNTR